MDDFFGGQTGGSNGASGGGSGKAASSSASSASAIQFGANGGGLVNDNGGLTPMAGIILGSLSLLAFVGLIIVAVRNK